MKSGFEKEIRRVRSVARRGREVAFFRVGFEALHSNMVGKLMFSNSIKPNQSESNQIKPVQINSSVEAWVDMVLTADVTEGDGMCHYDATLLVH